MKSHGKRTPGSLHLGSRRDTLKAGLSLGAALGVSGLSGLTIVGGAAAQGRNPWEDLPKGESAEATGLQLRTIGLGVLGAGALPPGVQTPQRA